MLLSVPAQGDFILVHMEQECLYIAVLVCLFLPALGTPCSSHTGVSDTPSAHLAQVPAVIADNGV